MFIPSADAPAAVVFQGLNGYVSAYSTKDRKHIGVEARMTGESLYPCYRFISGYPYVFSEKQVGGD